MATFKISIYDGVTRITSDSATCELFEGFTDDHVLTAAGDILRDSPYHSSNAYFAICDADHISTDIVSHSDGWDGDTYRIDLLGYPEIEDHNLDGDGLRNLDDETMEIVAIVEIERI